jgi:hypothetical protein
LLQVVPDYLVAPFWVRLSMEVSLYLRGMSGSRGQ